MSSKIIKLLYVEDNPDLIYVYATKFDQMEYVYKNAADGETAIKEAGEFMPDIILLDVILPKKDGFAVLKELKSSEKTKKIPVILFTSLGQDSDIQKGLDMGAASYISKSDCTPTFVIEEIGRVLGQKK